MAKSSENSIWLYQPSFPLAIVFAALYLIPMLWQLYLAVFKHKSCYFIVVTIGAALEVGGYIARAVSIKHDTEIPPYAVSFSLIVIAPLFIAAGSYLLLTRLCNAVLPSDITKIYFIPIRKLTKIFVISDVLSFLIQVSGSGIAASGNWEGNITTIGTNVLIAGLAWQLVSLGLFRIVIARFHVLTRRGVRAGAGEGWRKVLAAVYTSSGLVMIRSVYRLIEFALGIEGYPFTHDWTFYVFESVPMLPAILIFCVTHPAEYFGGRRGRVDKEGSGNEGTVV